MEAIFAVLQGLVDETSAAYKMGQYSVYVFAAIIIIVVLFLMRSKKK